MSLSATGSSRDQVELAHATPSTAPRARPPTPATLGRTERGRNLMAAYGEPAATRVAEINTKIDELHGLLAAASNTVRTRLHEPAIRTPAASRVEQERVDWLEQLAFPQFRGPSTGARPPPRVLDLDRAMGIHLATSPP